MVTIVDHIFSGVVTQAFPSWLPVPGRRRHREAVARIDEVVARVVRDGKPSRTYLMGALLKHLEGQTSERVSRELRDDAVTMFLNGHETTEQMLTWAVFALGRDPAIQDKLREELSAELSGMAPRFDDLPRLEYSRMVLSESLRKYAPVYWLARTAVADDVIDGFCVEKGQIVVALSHLLHHHPDHWREPERFAPERFSFEESQGRHPLAWVPFGTGQRRCVGQEFAMMEGQLALARVLQRYRLTPVAGKPTTMQVSTTLRPRGGVWMHLSQC
jgi:cytochrome P450